MVQQHIVTFFTLLSMGLAILTANGQKVDYNSLREKMVNEQIIVRGVKDEKVLDAMRKIKRHLFVPQNVRSHAYNDYPLPIGYGQTISQPYIVAFMTEVLNLEPTGRVLEIGTGSGYQAAILGALVDSVFTIEIVPELSILASEVLEAENYLNVLVKSGDGYLGWPAKAPFDAILVTCAPSHVPQPLKEQLAEGGRMIIPVGESGNVQELVLLEKSEGQLIEKSILPVRFVPMVNPKRRSY